jgi:hypothetical protein
LAKGVQHIIDRGMVFFVGLVDDETVLKYPCNCREIHLLRIENKLLEIAGDYQRSEDNLKRANITIRSMLSKLQTDRGCQHIRGQNIQHLAGLTRKVKNARCLVPRPMSFLSHHIAISIAVTMPSVKSVQRIPSVLMRSARMLCISEVH